MLIDIQRAFRLTADILVAPRCKVFEVLLGDGVNQVRTGCRVRLGAQDCRRVSISYHGIDMGRTLGRVGA